MVVVRLWFWPKLIWNLNIINPYSVLPRKKGMREGGRLPATTSASGRQNFTCPFSPGVVSLPPHLVENTGWQQFSLVFNLV